MATFEAQVEGLTSLSIDGSSAPTQAELTQFLTDGAAEVINAMPRSLKFLCATEDTFTSTAVGSEAETLESSSVISVTRNDGTIDQPCREIPALLRGRASDSDDMIAATATDPVYYVYNGKLNALPASGSCKYLEVNNPTVAFGDSSISNFPDEYEYLVPLYASVKALSNKLNSLIKSDLSISASAPSAPSLATVSYSDATNADASAVAVSSVTASSVTKADMDGNVPSYTAPVVGGATEEITATITAGTSGTDADQIDVTDWWEVLGDMIETDEDTELAQLQLGKLNSYIDAYRSALQNQLNIFNKDNARYQANVQAELAKKQADLQIALRQAQIDAADAQQESAQSTDVAKFNKAQDQALALQNKANTLQATIQNNDDLVQKFLAELNKYSAQVNSEVQAYGQNLANNAQAYQNYLQQQAKLQADYDKGIQLMRGG
jgi:hypothetical protein